MLMEWNDLETFEGNGLRPYHNRTHKAGRTIMQYASLGGLCLSILSLAMVMM